MITPTGYAPSKKPYALKLDSFAVDDTGKATVDAVWVGRKNGRTYVSEGHLWTFGPVTLDEFVTTFDGRYGGDCRARWNGIDLWVPNHTPVKHVAASARLNVIWTALPEVPDGYTGWYRLS